MIEAIIKIVGSIIPLAIRPFTRGRPEAEWMVKKFGVNPYTYIHIKNPGPRDVFIQEVRVDPPIYRVVEDESDTAIAGAAFYDLGASVILRKGEERDLPIIARRNQLGLSKEGPSQTVRFTIYGAKPVQPGCGDRRSGLRPQPTTSSRWKMPPTRGTAFHNTAACERWPGTPIHLAAGSADDQGQ